MASPASIGKHPLHPMLVAFPIGLWVFSLVSDIIYMSGQDAAWGATALYTMIGGTIGGVVAAIPGFIDYLSIQDERVNKIATQHMVLNLTIVALFTINILLRMKQPPGAFVPFALSVIGNLLLVISGWLGGHMVYVHGVAVETQRRNPQ